MIYKDLIKEAKDYFENHRHLGYDFAHSGMRDLIASKIDLCEDRDRHLSILEWKEYTPYKPMTQKEYEERKDKARKDYEKELEFIESLWNEQGKNSPDYHKI